MLNKKVNVLFLSFHGIITVITVIKNIVRLKEISKVN